MAQSKSGRIPALDGLRGLAVLLVFCFHYGGGAQSGNRLIRSLGEVNKAGWSGVTLFFVLSGFLITGILWDSSADPHWARNFYARRALRILPLYYGALLLTLLGAAAAGTFKAALHSLWISALFLQNFPGLSERVQQVPSPLLLHHLWSLAVEEQFYLLWPLLLFLQKSDRSAARLCTATFTMSLLFRVWLCATGHDGADWTGLLLSRSGELAAGGWLAVMYRGQYWQRIHPHAPAVCAAAAFVFLLTAYKQGTAELSGAWQVLGGLLAATVGFSALLVMALRPGFWQRVMSVAWLRWLGKISFGVYVFHILLRPIFWKVTHLLVPVSSGARYFVTRFLVAAVATVLVSWFSFRFYESPFLRFKKKFAVQAG